MGKPGSSEDVVSGRELGNISTLSGRKVVRDDNAYFVLIQAVESIASCTHHDDAAGESAR